MKHNKYLELTAEDQMLFSQGKHYDIYQKLGAHVTEKYGRRGVHFGVWAPEAQSISAIGEFNRWNQKDYPMYRSEDTDFWEVFIPGAKPDQLYKYYIITKDGTALYKADPFGISSERRPGTASKIASIGTYRWRDQEWMEARQNRNYREEPMYIYELHIGSWMRHLGYRAGNPERFYNYREFARSLVDYVKEVGYTHVEFIGIANYQNDYSWGYQVTNPFAVNSRHGSPRNFMYMVDYLHRHGIGVILDWVPAHFSKDEQGLIEFDGSCLYEYADPAKGNHPIWGTKVYDYGKGEVRSYLISNALYWLRQYHVDGLRVDAVDSMIHLDFGRKEGEWEPNSKGDNRNLEAIEMIKMLTEAIDEEKLGVFTIAEESTAFPKVTSRREDGGLGFTFKWNMGWEHDFLEYMQKPVEERKYFHQRMNFSLMYAYDESFIQILSHDNFGHQNKSMVNKLPGDKLSKMGDLRAAYVFMMGHPGKKMLFMGQDFAQEENWSVDREVQWIILKDPIHARMKEFMKHLIPFYKEHRCLFDSDYDRAGFRWVNADDKERSIFSFERYSKDRKQRLLFVCNFQPKVYDDYRVGAYKDTEYQMVFNSDEKIYGGSGALLTLSYQSEKIAADGRDYSFGFVLPAYAAIVFEF